MVYFLQQTISQNYTMGPGYLNSTTPVLSPPPFEIPPWAIRVNALWFASLLCSLGTASFGMLVKQWLREYLSADYVSPQMRVRAHVYRKKALADWQVLTIAAILPPLLQLALGLFFLGMCFFTAALQHSVSSTTFPLVAGWLFLIVTTTVIPLFSPRCPFKTPLLKVVYSISRAYIAPSVIRALKLILAPFFATGFDSASFHPDEEKVYVERVEKDSETLIDVDRALQDDDLLRPIVEAFKQSQPEPSSCIFFVTSLINHRLASKPKNQTSTKPTSDLPISRPIDSFELSLNLDSIPDLNSLSSECWVVLTDLLAYFLRRYLDGAFPSLNEDWVIDAIVLLLSQSHASLSNEATLTLNQCMEPRYWRTLAVCIADRQQNKYTPIGSRLERIFTVSDVVKSATPAEVMYFYAKTICPHDDHPHFGHTGLLSVLSDRQLHPDLFTNPTSRAIMLDLWTVLARSLDTQAVGLPRGTPNMKDGSPEAYTIIWKFSEELGVIDDAVGVTMQLWGRDPVTRYLFSRAATMHRVFRGVGLRSILARGFALAHEGQRLIWVFLMTLRSLSCSERDTLMQRCMVKVLRDYQKGYMDKGEDWLQFSYVRFCHLHLYIAEYAWAYDERASGGRVVVDFNSLDEGLSIKARPTIPLYWTELWTLTANAISRYQSRQGWTSPCPWREWHDPELYKEVTPDEILSEDIQLAHECLATMERLERLRVPDSANASPLFPSSLTESLKTFIALRASLPPPL